MSPHRTTELGLSPVPEHLRRRRKTDRENGDWTRVRWHIVFQVIGYIVGLFVIYNAMTNRITKVETRVDGMSSDITEMKADVKTLIRLVR